METLDLIHLNTDAVQGSVGEAANQVNLGFRRLERALLAQNLLPQELEDDTFSTPLRPVQRDGDLALPLRPLDHVGHVVQDPLSVGRVAAGDHVIVIGEVTAVDLQEAVAAQPLLYFRGQYRNMAEFSLA